MDDGGIASWVAGAIMAVLALFGLVLASRAVDPPFYLFGLALFAFGVACVFGLIVRHTGGGQPAAPGRDDAAPAEAAAGVSAQPSAMASRA